MGSPSRKQRRYTHLLYSFALFLIAKKAKNTINVTFNWVLSETKIMFNIF